MDKAKLEYFVSRYSELDEDDLAEVHSRADTLAEEASAALETVLAQRGIDRTLLVKLAKENEEPPPSLEPKRSKWLMAAQLGGAAFIIGFSSALAKATPRWVGLLIVLGYLVYGVYWVFRWFSKKK